MRQIAFIFIITSVSIVLLLESHIVDSLIVFLLSGSLPGTPIALSPTAMMALLTVLAWLIIARFTSINAFNFQAIKRFALRLAAKQKTLPKRRYSRI